jgi:para-nitrobenzyl esterase
VKWGPDTPGYAERIRAQFKDQADAVLKLYPPGATLEEDKATYAALFGDEIIGYGGWAWAERASAFTPTWCTLFTRPPGAPELSTYPLTGPGGLSQRGAL